MKLRFLIYFSILVSCVAKADWSQPSVAYKCSPEEKLFSLRGVVRANDEDSIPILPGYRLISDEKSTDLNCQIGVNFVEAKIEVIPVRQDGMCPENAFYYIQEIKLNDRKIMGIESFNLLCSSNPFLYKFDLSFSGDIVNSQVCTGTWDWGNEYEDSECKTTEIK
ncbi:MULTISPECIES: hypothetical protein [unclassified Duganella]|uniref:hypothetical protein n=1 Tax=unclassified Duganella TaxID=2636909 RepID=UPI0010299A6D|nr:MULTISPECIES: hypothetical protein [unclassified Duganella]